MEAIRNIPVTAATLPLFPAACKVKLGDDVEAIADVEWDRDGYAEVLSVHVHGVECPKLVNEIELTGEDEENARVEWESAYADYVYESMKYADV